MENGVLHPVILPEILEAQKRKIMCVIRKESAGPIEHVRLYDKYAPLASQQAEQDVDHFLSDQRSFQEIMMEVLHYQQLANEIQFDLIRVSLSVNSVIMAFLFR